MLSRYPIETMNLEIGGQISVTIKQQCFKEDLPLNLTIVPLTSDVIEVDR
jgi:hypothetical protein